MENAKTVPAPAPPAPEITETMDPRESITWPKGWVSNGLKVQVRGNSMFPFEYECEPGEWMGSFSMGPLPHRRVK